jgi:hypothetical protein
VSDLAPADLLPEPVSTVQVTTELMGILKLFLLLYLSLADYYLIYFRMKSKTIESLGKIRPVLPVFVHKEMLQRHSFDSFKDLSIEDVSGALTTTNQSSSSSSTAVDPEKQLDCYPDLSYGGSRNKVDSFQLSSPSSMAALSSAASSITYPTPARTR